MSTGGHINPAVTVALAIIGKFPWKKVPHYLLGQYIGAFWAAIVVFGVYYGKNTAIEVSLHRSREISKLDGRDRMVGPPIVI